MDVSESQWNQYELVDVSESHWNQYELVDVSESHWNQCEFVDVSEIIHYISQTQKHISTWKYMNEEDGCVQHIVGWHH